MLVWQPTTGAAVDRGSMASTPALAQAPAQPQTLAAVPVLELGLGLGLMEATGGGLGLGVVEAERRRQHLVVMHRLAQALLVMGSTRCCRTVVT